MSGHKFKLSHGINCTMAFSVHGPTKQTFVIDFSRLWAVRCKARLHVLAVVLGQFFPRKLRPLSGRPIVWPLGYQRVWVVLGYRIVAF